MSFQGEAWYPARPMLMWPSLFIGIALGCMCSLPVAWYWSSRTERRVRALEQRAAGAERLAELGQMTSGLAHEIKNPLSTIGLNVQLLSEDIDQLASNADDGPVDREQLARLRRRFDGLSREANRLRDILDDFLHFAGRIKLDPEPTNLHELLDDLAVFFTPQAEEAGVHLRTQWQAQQAILDVDQGLIKQAVLNLMINGVQAMQQARGTSHDHGGADMLLLRTHNEIRHGHNVLLVHVIDTGPGIDEQARAKIFQPYFSTKRGGTGLGLATTRRLIEKHGGQITVNSDLGRGSEFVIELPATTATPNTQQPAEADTPADR